MHGRNATRASLCPLCSRCLPFFFLDDTTTLLELFSGQGNGLVLAHEVNAFFHSFSATDVWALGLKSIERAIH